MVAREMHLQTHQVHQKPFLQSQSRVQGSNLGWLPHLNSWSLSHQLFSPDYFWIIKYVRIIFHLATTIYEWPMLLFMLLLKISSLFLLSSALCSVSMDLEHSKTWLILYHFIPCKCVITPLGSWPEDTMQKIFEERGDICMPSKVNECDSFPKGGVRAFFKQHSFFPSRMTSSNFKKFILKKMTWKKRIRNERNIY